MRWAPSLGKQAKAENKKVYGGSGLVRRPHVSYNPEWDVSRAVEDGLKKVTWVFRCVDAIASNAARVRLLVREGDMDDGEVVPSQVLKILNSKANPGESAFNFRYRLSAQILLSNKGAFIEVVRTRGGDIERLSLLHPNQVEPIKDEQTFVSGYRVTVKSSNSNQPTVQVLDPDDVIWIKHPHPFDAYTAMTPLESCGLAIETDFLAKLYNRNFLINDGRPGGMVVIKGDMMESDKEELRARFRGNVMAAGRVSVIASSDGADFVDTAVNPRDAQYIESRNVTKEEIQIAFGVPQSVLGNAADRTFDNAEMERLIFWMETMLPHMELQLRPMDTLVDDNEFLAPDLSRVDVLQRMEMKRREFLLREFDAGGISVDEYRSATGRTTIDNEWGEALFMSVRKSPFTTLSGAEAPGQPKPASDTGRPNNDDVTEAPEEEPRDREDDRIPGGVTPESRSEETPVLTKDEVHSALNDYQRWVTITESTLERFSERQSKVLKEKIGGAKTKRLIEKSVPVSEIISNVFNDAVWERQLREDLTPIVKGVIREQGVDYKHDHLVEEIISEMGRVNLFLKSKIASSISDFRRVDNPDIRVKSVLGRIDGVFEEHSLIPFANRLISKVQHECVVSRSDHSFWQVDAESLKVAERAANDGAPSVPNHAYVLRDVRQATRDDES